MLKSYYKIENKRFRFFYFFELIAHRDKDKFFKEKHIKNSFDLVKMFFH